MKNTQCESCTFDRAREYVLTQCWPDGHKHEGDHVLLCGNCASLAPEMLIDAEG